MLQWDTCNTPSYTPKIYAHIHVQKKLCWTEAKWTSFVEAKMSHFLETSVFSKRIPELSPNSDKICNLSFPLQVPRPMQVKAELRCKGFPQQHTLKTRSTVPWRTGDLSFNESDLSPAATSAGGCHYPSSSPCSGSVWHTQREAASSTYAAPYPSVLGFST